MAGWEGDILSWGIAKGKNYVVHSSCGLLLSDAHIEYPTEAFHWESNTFAAWAMSPPGKCNTKKYASRYTITSSYSGIDTVFKFKGAGSANVRLITDPYELLACRLWTNHPQALTYRISYGSFDEGKAVSPSQTSYTKNPLYFDFDCVITGYFTACCVGSISHSCTVRIYANWSPRASDLIRGFTTNTYPATGEDSGLATTWFNPTTQSPMTADEWHNYVCANMRGASRFLSNTKNNMI